MNANKILSSLALISGAKIASVVVESKVKLTGGKKNAMQDRVTKRTSGGNVIFGANYAKMMQKKYDIKGLGEVFCASARPWGERIKNTPFVTHKGNIYAEMIYLTKPSKVEYFLDGMPIAKEDIEGLPAARNDNSEVILRCVNLENIKALKMGDLTVKAAK